MTDTDIVERLKKMSNDMLGPYFRLTLEAADEIERLRAENADLRSRITVLSPEDHEAFLKALDEPPEPSEKLKALFRDVQ